MRSSIFISAILIADSIGVIKPNSHWIIVWIVTLVAWDLWENFSKEGKK